MPLPGGDSFNVQVIFSLESSQFMRGLQSISQSMTRAGRTLTQNLTLPIVAAGTAFVNASLRMSTAMADVATLIPGQTERVLELKKAVQDAAMAMGFSQTSLAGGMYQAVSAFGDSEETIGRFNVAVRLARAGSAETTEAVEFLAAATKGYGDISEGAMQQAADLGLLTVRLGQTTFPELAANIGQVTPYAAALDVDLSELMATMATLTGVTGNTAEVSTQLKAAMVSMVNASPALTAAMGTIEYSSARAMVSELGFVESMRRLGETTDGSIEALNKLFPNIRAMPAALALLQGQAETFDAKFLEMVDSVGTLDDALAEQTEGVNEAGFTWLRFKASAEVVASQFGDVLAPIFGQILTEHIIPMIERISELSDRFMNLDPGMQKAILAGIGIVAALGPFLMLVGQIIAIAPALATAFTVMFGPWGILIAAIIAGIALLVMNWESIRPHLQPIIDWFLEMWGDVKDWFIEQIPKIAEVWESVLSFMQAFWDLYGERIKLAWETIWTAIKIVFEVIWAAIKAIFDVALSLIKGSMDFWTAVFKGDWQGAWEAVEKTFKDIWDRMGEFFVEALGAIWNNLVEWGESVKNYFVNFYNDLVGHSIITDGNQAIVDSFEETFTKIEKRAEEFAKKLKDSIAGAYPDPNAIPPGEEGMTPGELARQETSLRAPGDDESEEFETRITETMQSLNEAILDGIQNLARSFVSGDIGKALEKTFNQLGSIIADHISTRITANIGGGGLFGQIAGAFGGGLIGAGISLLGGLFSKGSTIGTTPYNPAYFHMTNVDEIFRFGYTLPGTFIRSGRQDESPDIGAHGFALDSTRQTRRTGLHYTT